MCGIGRERESGYPSYIDKGSKSQIRVGSAAFQREFFQWIWTEIPRRTAFKYTSNVAKSNLSLIINTTNLFYTVYSMRHVPSQYITKAASSSIPGLFLDDRMDVCLYLFSW